MGSPPSTSGQTLLERFAADPAARAALVDAATVWAAQRGLVYGAGLPDHPAALVHAPLSLLPAEFPRAQFEAAAAAAPDFNALADAVAGDDAYLERTLAPAAAHDDFTAALLEVHRATAGARAAKRAAGADRLLAVTRSDYMLHAPTGRLLQVELNTIASSFGCLSSLVARLHAALLTRAGAPAAVLAALPANPALEAIADALGLAAARYDAAAGLAGADRSVVVMVVQPGERNAYDQHWLAAALWERHGARVERRTLAQLAAGARVEPAARGAPHGRLRLDGGAAVGVVYFRAGYAPADYPGGPSGPEWAARALVERSDAFLCPSTGLQLAGAKKVQQDLADAGGGALERFAPSPAAAAALRPFFAGQWALGGEGGAEAAAAVAAAAAAPGGFVLKPQREGGGNNLYGAALAARLAEGGPGLAAFILMQRIEPPPRRAVMVRAGAAAEGDTLQELGIFGVYVRDGDGVALNAPAGHLVRTKAAASDEGGVAAGFAVLDSPFLVD